MVGCYGLGVISTDDVVLEVRADVDDDALSRLHAEAFDGEPASVPWSERLHGQSLTWVTASRGRELVGFVNVVGDGGSHAFLLDTCVAPAVQGRGIGRLLVESAAREARALGCEWLHVDHEPEEAPFYEVGCGMTPTRAALLRLSGRISRGPVGRSSRLSVARS